jgi:methylglutaconyl-CoA hydratase
MSEEQVLLVEVDDDKVYWVTLNRPKLHNAFNQELIEQLVATFEKIASDDTARAVVLKGNGRSFSAGADINWMKEMRNYSLEDNIEDSKKLQNLFEVINNCPVPVITQAKGAVLGGGVGLVSVSDFVLAGHETIFGLTEVRLGLLPAVISPFVIDKIGVSHARSFFLSGKKFDAERAFAIGLIHYVAPNDQLDGEIKRVVKHFLRSAPSATRLAKELVKSVTSITDKDERAQYTAEMIAKVRASDEGKEGMSALLEKRRPAWVTGMGKTYEKN